jgi:hypothetical protein
MDLFISVLLVSIVKILVENKDIGSVLYDPPPVILSYKQLNENREKIMNYVSEEREE